MTLDASGKGDATSLEQAVAMVAPGGVIQIIPGDYYVHGVVIDRPVRLHGVQVGGTSEAKLQGEITVSSGEVIFNYLALSGVGNSAAVRVTGGNLEIYNSGLSAAPIPSSFGAAPTGAVAFVENGQLRLYNAAIVSNYGEAISSLGSNVSVEKTTLTSAGPMAVYAYGGGMKIVESTLRGKVAVVSANQTRLELVGSTVVSTNNYNAYGAIAIGGTSAKVSGNLFDGFPADVWYCQDRSVTDYLVQGNTSGAITLRMFPYCPDP